MSYTVFYQGSSGPQKVLYASGSEESVLDEMELKQSVSDAPEFKFKMYRTHPYYDDMAMGVGTVSVYEGFPDNTTKFLFKGFIEEIGIDLYGTKTVYCVGILGVLNNSIQKQSKFQGTPLEYLTQLLNDHSYYATTIHPGSVDATGTILRYTNYETTFECIRRDLMESFGLYPKLTGSSWYTLSLLTINNYGDLSDQEIHFGENLLNFVKEESKDGMYTAVIPLGKKKTDSEKDSWDVPELDAYVNIRSVQGGVTLVDMDARDAYGFRCAVVHWDDVTDPSTLKTKAQAWLNLSQFTNVRLSLTAIDLSLLGNDISEFKVGDRVRCVAEHLGVDVVLPIYEMTIYPLSPEKNTITIGSEAPTITSSASSGSVSGGSANTDNPVEFGTVNSSITASRSNCRLIRVGNVVFITVALGNVTSSPSTSTTLFTLPAGYRPSSTKSIQGIINSSEGNVTVDSSGNVKQTLTSSLTNLFAAGFYTVGGG